jgi:histidyl-tRNA synthetase
MFLGRDIPACGFSLGLERILVVMAERKMFPAAVERGPADVMVTVWNDAGMGPRCDWRAICAAPGCAPTCILKRRRSASSSNASERGIPFVAVFGDDEMAQGKVTIKDLRSGEQEMVTRDEAAEHIMTRLESARSGGPLDLPASR